MKFIACLLALLCVLSASPLAYAGDARTDAEVLAMRAKALFRANQYAEAAELYLTAYAKSRVPLMLYNAARATEEAGNLGEARALFMEYARLDTIAASERREAQNRADHLAKRLAKTTEPIEKPKVEPAVEPRGEVKPEPVRQVESQLRPLETVKPPRADVTQVQPQPQNHFPMWQTVGATVAAGAGVALWWLANDNAHQANSLIVHDLVSKQSYQNLADSARTWQMAAAGAGAVAGVLTIWAIAAGVSAPGPSKAAVGLAPAWDGEHLGATVAVGW